MGAWSASQLRHTFNAPGDNSAPGCMAAFLCLHCCGMSCEAWQNEVAGKGVCGGEYVGGGIAAGDSDSILLFDE